MGGASLAAAHHGVENGLGTLALKHGRTVRTMRAIEFSGSKIT
jgi:hypothetical protein